MKSWNCILHHRQSNLLKDRIQVFISIESTSRLAPNEVQFWVMYVDMLSSKMLTRREVKKDLSDLKQESPPCLDFSL